MVIAGAGFLGIWTKKFLVTFQVAGSFIHSNICDDKLGPKHSYSPISKALQYQISKHSYSPISRVNVSETTKLSPSKTNFKVQICCSMKALQVPGTGLSYYLAWCAIAADSFLFGSEDVKIQRASQQPGTKVAICIEGISCHKKAWTLPGLSALEKLANLQGALEGLEGLIGWAGGACKLRHDVIHSFLCQHSVWDLLPQDLNPLQALILATCYCQIQLRKAHANANTSCK